MGKYSDYFSNMSEEKKAKLREDFKKEYKTSKNQTTGKLRGWLAEQHTESVMLAEMGME